MTSMEDQRVLELYRYYVPDEDPPGSQAEEDAFITSPTTSLAEVSSPNTTLTALCQLVAIRLAVQRVGISLIGHRQQYILAEATRTLNLNQTTKSDDPADALVFGLLECSRVGNLCENTVALPPCTDGGIPPCYTILDLSKDRRFADAPYVATGPKMRFYCGTPITSKHGLNIGSFWILDNRLLPPLTSEQKVFFGSMASLVMKQLELSKDRIDRDRALKMRAALSCFVDGRLSLSDKEAVKLQSASGKVKGALRNPQHTHPSELASFRDRGISRRPQPGSSDNEAVNGQDAQAIGRSLSSLSEHEPSQIVQPSNSDRDERSQTFARATFLMREAFEVQGCVIFDTAVGFLTDTSEVLLDSKPSEDQVDLDKLYDIKKEHVHRDRPGLSSVYRSQDSVAQSSQREADILGFATEACSSLNGDEPTSTGAFIPIQERLLTQLTSRYPDGVTWSFSENGSITSEDETYPDSRRTAANSMDQLDESRRFAEAQKLQKSFPGVRQLLFTPFFDTNLGKNTSGCFLFTSSVSRVLSRDMELSYMRIFANNLAAELSRIDADLMDRSKTDFIGSISHELRSPLHGILAAADFLEDTELDSFQKSLITTQVSCGKTLLQVIEHVLDFSKINSFEKDERAARRQPRNSTLMHAASAKMQNMYARTDIAELFEEVVEGSVAGKFHSKRTADSPLLIKDTRINEEVSSFETTEGLVEVILDIDYCRNWTHTTQPGALRRIILNILGNALKYTYTGYIRAKLKIHEEISSYNDSMMELIVTDTGKGISKQFLRSRLFSPFSQEDHLSTGCGLGLSMVKSLVDSLYGQIEVRSEEAVGTTVSIKLPLASVSLRSSEDSTLESSGHALLEQGGPFADLDIPKGKTVSYINFDTPNDSSLRLIGVHGQKIRELLFLSISKCMQDWLQMVSISNVDDSDYVVVLVDNQLADFIGSYAHNPNKKQPKMIAVLQHEMQRRGADHILHQIMHTYEMVAAPIGPRKMASAVHACEVAARNWNETLHKGRSAMENGALGSQLLTAPEVHDKIGLSNDSKINSLERDIQAERNATPPPIRMRSFEANEVHPLQMASSSIAEPAVSPSTIQNIDNKQVGSTSRRKPHLLLVDDNKINLRLLETFSQKRTYTYDTAENGLIAVEAAQKCTSGYDVIFMDVSMPVMDGMEATRRIRALEKQRHLSTLARKEEVNSGYEAGIDEESAKPKRKQALVVALTGLANSRDQARAFASGIDLFMTKPVKFKEVGKLLDEWENEMVESPIRNEEFS